jgi:hypothetical protein
VGNLGSEALVMHKEEVNLSDVIDKELLEAIGKEMACLESRLEDAARLEILSKIRTFLLLP